MYCSSCGKAVSPGLSYCNRCGAELNAKDRGTSKPSEGVQESLVWALVVVTIVGIGAVIGMMAVMKEVVHFSNELILPIALVTFLSFLGVDSVIIWLLLRPRREIKELFVRAREKEIITNELEDSKARVLPEPIYSVTDHTTHTLDPADRKRQHE